MEQINAAYRSLSVKNRAIDRAWDWFSHTEGR
jgi:hypothetical protein